MQNVIAEEEASPGRRNFLRSLLQWLNIDSVVSAIPSTTLILHCYYHHFGMPKKLVSYYLPCCLHHSASKMGSIILILDARKVRTVTHESTLGWKPFDDYLPANIVATKLCFYRHRP